MATAVIYARYSSEKQREESIEGQIRKCTEYAARNGITIIESYIDRAISGTTDERPAFQQMIADSAKKKFDMVLVYALNRFSRDFEHYYRYRQILTTNSVTLKSATEEVPPGPSGIIYESVLVGFNVYYSAELAEKIRRGQDENAHKGMYNGGSMPLGYTKDAEQHYAVEHAEAAIVVEIFTRYADGETITEIINSLNLRGLRTKRGNEFNKNSLHTILKNKRYLGVYEYRDVVIEGAFEPIITPELFEKVQKRLGVNKVASAHKKADEPFILTTKIFCGDCGAAMIGESGTSRNGSKHYYYKCSNNKRKKLCRKKAVKKHVIEDIVIHNITQLLFSDERLQEIANLVMEIQEKSNTVIPMLQRELKEVNRGISNLLDAIQKVGLSDSMQQRYEALEKRKSELEISIKTEQLREKKLSRDEVLCWLERFRGIDTSDIKQREMLVNIFVNAVFVFDDHLVIVYNFKDNARTTELTEVTCQLGSGSDIACSSPPNKRLDRKIGSFCLKAVWRENRCENRAKGMERYMASWYNLFGEIRICGGVMKKEYLFHGSPIRVDKLIPSQACDVEYEEGCQYAVYATTNKIMAILFSMGCVEEGDGAERIMMPEYGDKMFFKNCHPNYNSKGYIYHLEKSKFVHAMGSQWVCYDEIVPDFIEEIDVNDYLDYCIIEEQKV